MNETDWLLIPGPYVSHLGELVWSPACDAVVDGEGSTLVLAHSLAQFVEGAGAQDGLVHFAFVLHFLHRLLTPDEPAGFEAMRKAWATQSVSLRNAGSLFAELTHALPRVPGKHDVRRLGTLLRQQTNLAEVQRTSRSATVPPLSFAAFDEHLARMLSALSEEDIRHWLRHGRGPRLDDVPPLNLPPPPPRTLGGFLDEALNRKRMAGVAPFIDQMISALTLPPRRAQRTELPVGGYSSVTNRGHPDQILPGEFAVDELEFLRRYAENELLYWQREEPQSQVREDMIVLCDQGVRTWGDSRLALTAGAIALGKRAEQRGTPVRFASTGNGGEPTTENLGALLEASDLTPNPGLALERVLEEPAFEVRDVVLLTHPRSLLEEDVRAAARRAPAHVRLFALSIDSDDGAELSELRRGEPVSLRRFQLARPRKAARAPVHEAEPNAPWTGPLEPIGFPFRFGLVGTPQHVALDTLGRHMFTSCNHGLLHAWRLEADTYELLPRPMIDGEVVKQLVALVGVSGGFVCIGLRGAKPYGFHYDLIARRMTALPSLLATQTEGIRAEYLAAHHSVVVRTGELHEGFGQQVISLDGRNTTEAVAQATALGAPLPPRLRLVSQPTADMLAGGASGRPSLNTPRNALLIQANEGRMAVLTEHEFWKAWAPRSDGGLLLKGAFVRDAVCAGGTLGVRVQKEGREHVLLFSGPEWQLLGEFNTQIGLDGLAISGDGRRVAFRNKPAHVVCFEVGDGAERIQAAQPARHHTALTVEVGDSWFTVYGGKFTHLIRWDRERLEIAFLQAQCGIAEFIKRKADAAALNPQHVQLRAGQPGPGRYDPARFTHYGYSRSGLLLMADNCGQISIFNKEEKLLAMFYVYRGTVAGWLPDGTRYGPASITGGPTSPGALGKIGAALKAGSN